MVVMHVVLLVCCVAVAVGQVSVFQPVNSTLMQLTVHNDNIYVATEDTLYQLNDTLDVLNTGQLPEPSAGTGGCGPSDLLSVSVTATFQYPKCLFVCSTRGTGVCEIRSLTDVSNVIDSKELPNVADNSSSFGLPSSLNVVSQDGNLLYQFAQPHGGCSQFPSVALLQVRNSSLNVTRREKLEGADWMFVGGFVNSQYVYITASQTFSISRSSKHQSVVMRFCESLVWIEGSIKCGQDFTIVTAQTVITIRGSRFLLATFRKPLGRKGSAVCAYEINSLESQFESKLGNCSRGVGYQGLMRLGLQENCTAQNQTAGVGKCPSSQLQLQLTTNDPLIMRDNDEMISLSATSTNGGFPLILFAGTKQSMLFRFEINNLNSQSEVAFSTHNLSSSLGDVVQLEMHQTDLLVVTRNQVVTLPVRKCSEASTCSQCLSPAYATFCGWCYGTDRCGLLSECIKEDVWVRSECIRVLDASPSYIESSQPTNVIVGISGIPTALNSNDVSLKCVFGAIGERPAMKLDDSRYQCTTPVTVLFPVPYQFEGQYDTNVEIVLVATSANVSLGNSSTLLSFHNGCTKFGVTECVECNSGYFAVPLVEKPTMNTQTTTNIQPTTNTHDQPTTIQVTSNARTTVAPTTGTTVASATTVLATNFVNATENSTLAGRRRRRSIENATANPNATAATSTQQQQIVTTLITQQQPTSTQRQQLLTTSTQQQQVATTATQQVTTPTVRTTVQTTTIAATTKPTLVRCHRCTVDKCKSCQSSDQCDLCQMGYVLRNGACAMTTPSPVFSTNATTTQSSTSNATESSPFFTTQTIIIIAACGGGGLLLLIILVCLCCCVTKARRHGKASIAADNDFVASNLNVGRRGTSPMEDNPLTSLKKSTSQETTAKATTTTAFTNGTPVEQELYMEPEMDTEATSSGHRPPPVPPHPTDDQELYIVPEEPPNVLKTRVSPRPSQVPPLVAPKASALAYRSQSTADELYIDVGEPDLHSGQGRKLPVQEDLYLAMDARPPSPHSALPEADDIYLAVDEPKPIIAHPPVSHRPSDSYVTFIAEPPTKAQQQSTALETEDLYVVAYDDGGPDVEQPKKLSRNPTPKKALAPPQSQPDSKVRSLDPRLLSDLKKQLGPGELEEDDFYENLPGRSMTDAGSLQQVQGIGNRHSQMPDKKTGYEGGDTQDIYQNLRGRLVSDPKAVNLSPRDESQMQQPHLVSDDIYGNQDVVDSSRRSASMDQLYGNSDLVEEQVYANT